MPVRRAMSVWVFFYFKKMKTLSIKQPWASLIAHGIKDIENRTWKTNHRGKIYIHASASDKLMKTKPIDIMTENQIEVMSKYLRETKKEVFSKIERNIYSCIIGEVEIIDCVINHPSIWAEKTFIHQANESNPDVDDDVIIYNWVLENPILYDKPILNVKGKLSLWEFEM